MHLTLCILIEEEWCLELDLQVFGNWLHQILCAESVHDHKPMSRISRPREKRKTVGYGQQIAYQFLKLTTLEFQDELIIEYTMECGTKEESPHFSLYWSSLFLSSVHTPRLPCPAASFNAKILKKSLVSRRV